MTDFTEEGLRWNRCETCAAYDKRENKCRRNVPHRDMVGKTTWPTVFNLDWCMQWIPESQTTIMHQFEVRDNRSYEP